MKRRSKDRCIAVDGAVDGTPQHPSFRVYSSTKHSFEGIPEGLSIFSEIASLCSDNSQRVITAVGALSYSSVT